MNWTPCSFSTWVDVPQKGRMYLFYLSVGWGGPNGRTPMVSGVQNGEVYEAPLAMVRDHFVREAMADVLRKAAETEEVLTAYENPTKTR